MQFMKCCHQLTTHSNLPEGSFYWNSTVLLALGRNRWSLAFERARLPRAREDSRMCTLRFASSQRHDPETPRGQSNNDQFANFCRILKVQRCPFAQGCLLAHAQHGPKCLCSSTFSTSTFLVCAVQMLPDSVRFRGSRSVHVLGFMCTRTESLEFMDQKFNQL